MIYAGLLIVTAGLLLGTLDGIFRSAASRAFLTRACIALIYLGAFLMLTDAALMLRRFAPSTSVVAEVVADAEVAA